MKESIPGVKSTWRRASQSTGREWRRLVWREWAWAYSKCRLNGEQLTLICLGHSQCQHSNPHVQELPGSGQIEILGHPTYSQTWLKPSYFLKNIILEKYDNLYLFSSVQCINWIFKSYLLIAPLFFTDRKQHSENALSTMKKEPNSFDSPRLLWNPIASCYWMKIALK